MNKIKINIIITVIIFSVFIISLSSMSRDKNIEMNNKIDGIYNRKFKEHVVFYPQHQDDEVLWGGSAIVKSIESCGADNVYVVLVSDGTGVNVFKDKKYKGLSRKEKQALRDAEFKGALSHLGIKDDNIIYLANIDKYEGTHFELMKKTILEFEYNFESVTHVAHHYKYDNHPMHRKNGKKLKELEDNGQVKDVLYFIKPKYINKVQEKDRVIYEVDNLKDYDKVKNACDEYRVIDSKNKKEGIGYKSAHSYFDHLLEDPKLKSYFSIR